MAPDAFWLNRVFPDPQAIFNFSPKSAAEVKQNCLFVLDTNALLVPYNIEGRSLSKLKVPLAQLVAEERLIIPGHVAREFAKNRPKKITELYDSLTSRMNAKAFDGTVPPLFHGSADAKTITALAEESQVLREKYVSGLNVLVQLIEEWRGNDPVSELYASLFEGNALYDPAWTAEERCEISADWLWRLANEVPPGFKDASAGDLIIWRTILRLGAERKRSVTFVSFDRKRDWWHRHKGGPLHPRFELIDEFRRASGGESFNIVSLNEMLEMIGTEPRLVSAVAEEEGSRFWNAEDEEASGWRHCGGELSFSIKKYLADQVGGWYENESVHEHPSGLHVLEWSGKRIAYFERNISPRDAVDGAWVRSVHDCVAAYKRENPDDEVHVIFAHPSAGVLTPFKELHGWYLQTRINYLQSATIAFISEQGPI